MTNTNTNTRNAGPLVAKIWNYCHTLRDDGMGYGDYLEQPTYRTDDPAAVPENGRRIQQAPALPRHPHPARTHRHERGWRLG